MLIDTHTHLDDARYESDREAMIARAREAGVDRMITIGCDLATSRSAVALANQYPFVYASVGVHPHEVKHITDGWYDELRQLAREHKVVAYGEIGLDYHYNHSDPELQRRRFREQLQLARELSLPVIIHTREAQDDTIRILKEEQASEIGGVFHCFSGDAWLAKDALEMGFYLSFSGILTFQNATMLREIARTIPADRLLIETDCPSAIFPIFCSGTSTRSRKIAVRNIVQIFVFGEFGLVYSPKSATLSETYPEIGA